MRCQVPSNWFGEIRTVISSIQKGKDMKINRGIFRRLELLSNIAGILRLGNAKPRLDMKSLFKNWQWPAVMAIVALIAFPASASFIQLVSQRDGSLPPVAGGGGSSQMPIVSADGRYVLFRQHGKQSGVNEQRRSDDRPDLAEAECISPRSRQQHHHARQRQPHREPAVATEIPFRFGISTNGRFVLFESAPPTWSPTTPTTPRTSLSATWSAARLRSSASTPTGRAAAASRAIRP